MITLSAPVVSTHASDRWAQASNPCSVISSRVPIDQFGDSEPWGQARGQSDNGNHLVLSMDFDHVHMDAGAAYAPEFECFKLKLGGVDMSWADTLELGEDTNFTLQPQSEFTPMSLSPTKWESDSIHSWDSHSQSGFDTSSEAGWSSVWSGSQYTDNDAAVSVRTTSCSVSDCASPTLSSISTPTAAAMDAEMQGSDKSSIKTEAPSREEEPAKRFRAKMIADKTSVSSLASLLDKPLPPQVALAMLTSTSFNPGSRPPIFNEAEGQWLFKEHSEVRAAPVRGKQSKDEQRADRWHNSGGVRGSRDMPVKGSEDTTPIVRRRYGSIVRNKKITYRYHEYSLLHVHKDESAPDGTRIEEDRSTAIFHVMPKRTGKGRPSKAEADEPLQLWQSHPYGRTLVLAQPELKGAPPP